MVVAAAVTGAYDPFEEIVVFQLQGPGSELG